MKTWLATLVMAVFFMAPAAGATPAQETAAAQKSATAWLKLLDSGQYGESWNAASRYWKADHTKEVTQRVLKEQRDLSGRVLSRQLSAATLLAVPDGDCVHIEFKTSFTKNRAARESIDMLREESGAWKVASWSWRVVD